MVHRTTEDRLRVIGLAAAGRTKTQIRRETGFNACFVNRWFGRTDPADAPHPGRPTKLDPPTVHTVRALMKGKKQRSTRKVSALLRERKGLELSRMTVWRAARRANLTAYHKQRKPLLTADGRRRRLEFAQTYIDTEWRHVLFVDEKSFHLFGHPNRQNDVVWETAPENVPPNVAPKHPAKVHVWGAISYYGTLEPYIFQENLTAELYIDILEARLPAAPDLFPGRRWLLLQDNDPKHTSTKVVTWLKDNVPSFIPKEHWPPNSPDINVIEPLWAHFQDRVYGRSPRTIDGLKRIIREEWAAIEPERLQRLVDSMTDRLNAVLAANGGHTKY